MTTLVTHRAARAAVFAGGILLALGPAAPAPAQTWTGGGNPDPNWNDPANWSGGTPVSGLTTAITFAGTNNLNPNQNIAGTFVLNSLTFAAGAGSFNLGGNALQFDGNNPSIVQSSASDQTITCAVL